MPNLAAHIITLSPSDEAKILSPKVTELFSPRVSSLDYIRFTIYNYRKILTFTVTIISAKNVLLEAGIFQRNFCYCGIR